MELTEVSALELAYQDGLNGKSSPSDDDLFQKWSEGFREYKTKHKLTDNLLVNCGVCPDCANELIQQSGCKLCRCGFSPCW